MRKVKTPAYGLERESPRDAAACLHTKNTQPCKFKVPAVFKEGRPSFFSFFFFFLSPRDFNAILEIRTGLNATRARVVCAFTVDLTTR